MEGHSRCSGGPSQVTKSQEKGKTHPSNEECNAFGKEPTKQWLFLACASKSRPGMLTNHPVSHSEGFRLDSDSEGRESGLGESAGMDGSWMTL